MDAEQEAREACRECQENEWARKCNECPIWEARMNGAWQMVLRGTMEQMQLMTMRRMAETRAALEKEAKGKHGN